MDRSALNLKGIAKIYPHGGGERKTNLQVTDESVIAVQKFNLDIAGKEFIVLAGPSGCGQRHRVAIVREPRVLLMDELLSNLDAKLRNQMRAKILKLRQKINTAFMYVTHDQTEVMILGGRIVIMKDGFIRQIGTPQRKESGILNEQEGTPRRPLLPHEPEVK